jgi:hypothetical protein
MRKSTSGTSGAKALVTNATAEFSGCTKSKLEDPWQPTRLSLSWEHEGARYHVWLKITEPYDISRGELNQKPTLFKNPLKGSADQFHTRRLDPTKKVNAAMIEAARSQVDFKKALQDSNTKQQEDDENSRPGSRRTRLHRKTQSGRAGIVKTIARPL